MPSLSANSFINHKNIPVSTASASLDFQCLAMFSESGSSGFGALNRAWILKNANNLIILLLFPTDSRLIK